MKVIYQSLETMSMTGAKMTQGFTHWYPFSIYKLTILDFIFLALTKTTTIHTNQPHKTYEVTHKKNWIGVTVHHQEIVEIVREILQYEEETPERCYITDWVFYRTSIVYLVVHQCIEIRATKGRFPLAALYCS